MESSRILVIEDCPEDRELLVSRLTNWGLAVRAAANGSEGLKALESERYAAVMLNLKLPGIDGLTLLRMCRERWPELMPFIISGYDDPKVWKQVYEGGAVCLFPKPFSDQNVMVLLAMLRESRDAFQRGRALSSNWRTSVFGVPAAIGCSFAAAMAGRIIEPSVVPMWFKVTVCVVTGLGGSGLALSAVDVKSIFRPFKKP